MGLAFGCRFVTVPDGCTAWGARAIFRPNDLRSVDLLPDRVDAVGPHKADLLAHLNSHCSVALLDQQASLFFPRGNEQEHAVLHEDGYVRVVASPQGSCGYLYITAIWKDDPDGR